VHRYGVVRFTVFVETEKRVLDVRGELDAQLGQLLSLGMSLSTTEPHAHPVFPFRGKEDAIGTALAATPFRIAPRGEVMAKDTEPSKWDVATGFGALVLLLFLTVLGVGDSPQIWAHKDTSRQVHASKKSDETSGQARFQ